MFLIWQGKKSLTWDEIPNKSIKKEKTAQRQLSYTKKVIDKCSYASSSTSCASLPCDLNIHVLDCKCLFPPTIKPSAMKPPTPNVKIYVDEALNVWRKMTPSKHNKLSVVRQYHKKLPKLVRNDIFFTIQGYSLPPSMAYMTKFAPRTPKDHEHLAVIRRPLFQDDINSPFPTSIVYPFKSVIQSKSRLSRDYISRARDRVDRIDKFCKNWPWKIKSPPKNTNPLKVELV